MARLALATPFSHLGRVVGDVFWSEKLLQGPTEHLPGLVAEDFFHAVIDEGRARLGVNPPDAFIRGFDDPG